MLIILSISKGTLTTCMSEFYPLEYMTQVTSEKYVIVEFSVNWFVWCQSHWLDWVNENDFFPTGNWSWRGSELFHCNLFQCSIPNIQNSHIWPNHLCFCATPLPLGRRLEINLAYYTWYPNIQLFGHTLSCLKEEKIQCSEQLCLRVLRRLASFH